MSCQYRCLVSALTCCTLLAIAVTAHAATTITPDAAPTAAETAAVRQALRGDERLLTFTVGHADLNGDGRPDLIIHSTDQDWCGSHGCYAYALLAGPAGYSTHAIMLAIFEDTMTVLDTTHHGMHDVRFDDSTYVFHWTGTAYEGSDK